MTIGFNGKGLLALVPGLFLVLSACNSADFGSSSGTPQRNKSALTGKGGKDGKDGRDGADASDGPDADGADGPDGKGDSGNDGKDSGGSDSGDGKDTGGTDSGKDSGGKDSGGIDESDSNGDGKDDLGGDDGEVTATNSGPLTITRKRKDQGFQIKLELLYKDQVKKTETREPPGEGESITVEQMCRKGAKRTTQLRVTITGKATWSTLGIQEDGATNTSTCIYATRLGDKDMQLDFDPGGFGGKGSNCGKGEDDILTLSCPDSKKLELK